MNMKKMYRHLALATAGVTIVSVMPVQAIAEENLQETKTFDLKKADLRLAVGESQTLKAVADFLEGQVDKSSYKIEWSVNEEGKKYVSIDNRGKVTAKAAGKAEITAMIKGEVNLKATISIDVYSTVEKLEVKNKVINLRVGETLPIEYKVLPEVAVQKDVKFISESGKIAKVNNKGLVTGVEEGQTKITLTTVDAGLNPFTNPITEEVTVNVTSTVTGVECTNVPNKKLELEPNETFELKWAVLPSNAYLKDVTFRSTNPNAATVNSKGIIKGTTFGGSTQIIITTKDGKYTETINVDVKGDSFGVALSGLDVETERQENGEQFIDLFVGEEMSLKVTPSPKDFNLLRTLLDFEVADPTVVDILPNGKMTALKPGETKVRVFYEPDPTIFKDFIVTVKSTVTGIQGDKEWTLRVGEIGIPPVNVLPVATAQNKDMILTHDGKGLIKVTSGKQEIVGLKPGVVNATFVTEDGGYEHQMQIKVISTVTSFDIPFETVKLGLEPYQFVPVFNTDAYLKEVKYEIADKKIISINSSSNTITPKSEGTTTVRAITVDGELVDEFEVVVDYDAKQISIYDENDTLIGTSDTSTKPTKPGGSTDNKELRRMIIEKLLEKADNEIVREVLKRLLNKI